MSVPPPNVKVYDRPASKTPSPMIIVIVLLVVAIAGYFIYKAMHHDAPTPTDTVKPAVIMMSSVSQTDAINGWKRQPFVFVTRVRL